MKHLIVAVLYGPKMQVEEERDHLFGLAHAADLETLDSLMVIWDNSFTLAEMRDERVLLRSSKNLGFAKAVNRASKEAEDVFGPYDRLLLLNADLELDLDTLIRIIQCSGESSSTTIWAPMLLNPDGSVQTGPDPLTLPTPIGEVLSILGRPYRPTGRATRNSYLRGAVLSIPASIFRAGGGFDERFFLYGEEADFCFRVKGMAGLRLDDCVRVVHRGSQGYKSKSPAALGYSLSARVLLQKRYAGRLSASAAWLAAVSAMTARLVTRRMSFQQWCTVNRVLHRHLLFGRTT